MVEMLTDQFRLLTNGIMAFKPVRGNEGGIVDFEWRLLNTSSTQMVTYTLVADFKQENISELFQRFVKVMETGAPDNFLHTFCYNSNCYWFQISVVRWDSGLIVSCNNITEQKLAEEELKKREQTYRLLTENATDLISRVDTQGHIQYCSPSVEKILGYKPEDLADKAFYDFIHPDDIPGVAEAHLKFLNAPEKDTVIFRFRCKDGQYKWLESISKPIVNEPGEVVEIQSSVRDITRRKKVEELLQKLNLELERRVESKSLSLQAVLDNAPVILWTVDRNGIITYMEGKGLSLLGLPPQAGKGVSIYEFFKNYPRCIKNIEKALQGESFSDKATFEGRHYMEHYFLSKSEDTEVAGMAAIAHDITELEETQNQLLASEAKYKAMAEGIPQLVWTALPDGSPDYYNKNWYDYTGQTEAEAMNQGWDRIIHPEDLYKLNTWKDAVSEGRLHEKDVRIKRASDGMYRWHLIRAWPARGTNGEIIKWVGTCTDVHDRLEQNEELKLKNRELVRTNNDLDNFVYTASHDLRAPISNIEGLLSAIENSVSDQCEEDIRFMFGLTKESLIRLKRTISELTEISQIQRSIYEDVDVINIGREVEDFKLEYKEQIEAVKPTFVMDLQIEEIRFSRKNFHSVIYNLLSNALKFHSPDRPAEIYIRTRMAGDNCLLLLIKDNGIGFDISKKDKVFSMFKRLHSHVEGTGVGLYIVKRIIENTGGRIEVDSEVGKGTTFKLFFNLSQQRLEDAV